MMLRTVLFVSLVFLAQGCSTVVSTTTGGTGVKEDPGRRSLGTMIDDSSIETTVDVNIDAADPALKASHITVVSFNGVVLLVGQVPSQDLKNLATRVATSSTRVKTVHNELEIAGATTLEDGVILWGQVGVSKTLTIGKNAVVFAQSGVGSDIEGDKVYFGSPVQDAKVKQRELVWIKRIPELWEKVMGK
jgi:uncharacterized protein YceK